MTRCRVNGARYGLVVDDSDGTVEGCEFSALSEDGIIVRIGASPRIRANTITRCGNGEGAGARADRSVAECYRPS